MTDLKARPTRAVPVVSRCFCPTPPAGELTRYPLTLFPAALRVTLTVVIPFAFIGFFPADFLTGSRALWIALVTPAVAAYCMLLAVLIFRRGMLRYESTGS